MSDLEAADYPYTERTYDHLDDDKVAGDNKSVASYAARVVVLITGSTMLGGRWSKRTGKVHLSRRQHDNTTINADHFDDSYRHKFWFLDLVLVILLCGGLVVAILHAIESDVAGISMLSLGFRTLLFKLVMDIFVWMPWAFIVRTCLLKGSWMRVSDKHYHQIMANRDDFCLQELQEAYGELKLRKFDCAARKGFHFIWYAVAVTIELGFLARGYSVAATVAFMSHGLIWQTLRCISLYGNFFVDNLYVQSWLYYAPRVRDGREGYINIRVAQTLTVVVTPICNLLLDAFTDCGPSSSSSHEEGEVDYTNIAQSMVFLIFLPVALGDAMGEIIGSFWGTHKFAVKGFGKVNKKSLEGCGAVFIFSLGATMLSTFVFWPEELPSLEWKIILPVCVAALSTLTETIAFRSTDNFLIPVCNAVLVILVYKHVREEC